MATLSKAKIAELKKEHGLVFDVKLMDGDVFYIKPLSRKKNAEVQNLVQKLNTEGADEQAANDQVEDLVLSSCVLEPIGEELLSFLEARAGIGQTLVEQIYSVSGFMVLEPPTKL